MKLLDQALERAKPVQALADGLKACAVGLERLASTLTIVAHNQAVHHQMIIQMWSFYQLFIKKINEENVNIKLPDLKPSDVPQKHIDKKKPN